MIACGVCGGQEGAVLVFGLGLLTVAVHSFGWVWLRACATVRKIKGGTKRN